MCISNKFPGAADATDRQSKEGLPPPTSHISGFTAISEDTAVPGWGPHGLPFILCSGCFSHQECFSQPLCLFPSYLPFKPPRPAPCSAASSRKPAKTTPHFVIFPAPSSHPPSGSFRTLLVCSFLLFKSTQGAWKHTAHTKACTPMAIAALLTIAKKEKQPKCRSMAEGINKICQMCTMGYYSAVERRDRLIPATRRNLKTPWQVRAARSKGFHVRNAWNSHILRDS